MERGRTVLVLGQAGSGKTSSLRNLNPSETLIIMSHDKELPFPGWANNYVYDKIEKGKGCILICKNFDTLKSTLIKLFKEGISFKNIVFDDFQFYSQRDLFGKAEEKNFDKWIVLAKNISDILLNIIGVSYLRKVNLIILWHANSDDVAREKGTMVKTGSKFIDEKLTIESLFTTVLLATVQDGEYLFQTNSTGETTNIKSPMGAFDLFIPNDINYVLKRLDDYSKGNV